MDDNDTVQAPVTRLRRKLTSQVEEVISPANNTPTKKRVGKLAAKPQLELIDENVTENVLKTPTKTAAAKTLLEVPEEKTVITPSRRSTRIKSSTSLVLEPTVYDSPRAKRAARRRSSLAGSDNEAPSTPLRQTKRTRKTSTTSIDEHVGSTITKTPEMPEAIVEESENKDENIQESEITTPKKNCSINEHKSNCNKSIIDTNENKMATTTQSHIITLNDDNTLISVETIQNLDTAGTKSKNKDNTIEKDEEQSIYNNSCDNQLTNVNDKPEKTSSVNNKNSIALELLGSNTNRRHRTKSWTTISPKDLKNDNFCSDSEITKKKKEIILNRLNSAEKLSAKNRSINKESEYTLPVNIKHNSYKNIDLQSKITNHKAKLSESKDATDANLTAELFKTDPGEDVKFSLLIEESGDSNTESISKEQQSDGQDQCVPIVDHGNANEYSKINFSYEPMDVDETIPQNTSLHFQDNNSTGLSEHNKTHPKRLSLPVIKKTDDQSDVNLSKSKRISSNNLSDCKSPEKSNNENKSTLVLSQINDTLGNENIISSKSTPVCEELLSKTVDISKCDKNKEIEMPNMCQDYSTSTPLQQKALKKTNIKLDNSLVSPKHVQKEIFTKTASNNNGCLENDLTPLRNVEKKEKSFNNSRKISTRESTSEEELSGKENSIIDNEAQEANENYESGDSQDEEEREYEMNNEITEKGETLESEDFSEDTDYEKDSFVVSSAEEDNELLSGSGDNLSLSDNELTMSSKSKAKFNKRKVKEQKKASREIYNARHKLNKSESSDEDITTVKKMKRRRLNSSILKSDNEHVPVTENSKQSFLNNSFTNADHDEFTNRKKKKVKRLSESVNDDSIANEKEMSIHNRSQVDKVDPLFVHIKEEIHTPLKNINISTVHIDDDVEEINVNENMSIIKPNDESSDPLNAVSDANNSESSNDNVEIIENYNSVLMDLHKNSKKTKHVDISLNTVKTKKKVKEPIIEELNLTSVKSKKSENIALSSETKGTKYSENEIKPDKCKNEDDESSDSLDMRLLFPEETSDSDSSSHKIKKNISNRDSNHIPLKKTEGKINLRDNIDKETNDSDIFFIDTKGSSEGNTSAETSVKRSAKKNKNNDTSVDLVSYFEEKENTPHEITSSGKKKKNKSLLQTNNNISDLMQNSPEIDVIYSEKKNRKLKSSSSVSADEFLTQFNILESEASADTSNRSSSCKKKKKRSKHSIEKSDDAAIYLQELGITEPEDPVNDMSSGKKKKKAKLPVNTIDESMTQIKEKESALRDVLMEASSSSKKKKKSKYTLQTPQTLETDALDSDEAPTEVPYESNRNKKQSGDNVEVINFEDNQLEEASADISNGKKKKKKSKNLVIHLDECATESTKTDDPVMEAAKDETSYQSHKKKHSKQSVVHTILENTVNNSEGITTHEVNPSTNVLKKRKRKHNSPEFIQFENKLTSGDTNVPSQGNERKKRKFIQSIEVLNNDNEASQGLIDTENHTVRKLKNKKQPTEVIEVSQGMAKKRKRKERDEDDSGKAVKVSTQSSTDKGYVQRLPIHILNQLEDKPAKKSTTKKPEVLSTTNFVVEDNKTARNKPSVYLEESVYLNDSPVKKKIKKTIKIPKVLPFLPTASTSDSGFTTNFRISVLPSDNQFVAQCTSTADFKKDSLQKSKLKKFRTFEKYKSQMKYKLSKF